MGMKPVELWCNWICTIFMCMLTLCKLTEVFYFPSLVCEDISFGKEDIPIPVINVIDNPPIAPPGKLLTNLCFYEGSGSGRQTIYIKNSFAYIFQASAASQGNFFFSMGKIIYLLHSMLILGYDAHERQFLASHCLCLLPWKMLQSHKIVFGYQTQILDLVFHQLGEGDEKLWSFYL